MAKQILLACLKGSGKVKNLLNFLLPNLSFIWHKQLKSDNLPKCNQKLLLSGNGSVVLGKNITFGYKLGGFFHYGLVELQARMNDAKIAVGDNVATNNNIFICAANRIDIGENCRLGQNVTIMDFEAHNISPSKRNEIGEIGAVIIEENVWVGNNVTILKNSFVGKNSIVATGAVVSGKFPANVILGGVPAKIIKEIC